MKKIFSILLILLLIGIAPVGCSKKEEPAVGAYSEERELTADDVDIFNEALGEGALKYKPSKVATQVVAGMKYKFSAKDIDANKKALIIIFDPFEEGEAATVIEILPVE